MKDCLFCKIVNGEIPCTKIYEDSKTLAFLDISPATNKGGHTLVITKKHYETIADLKDSDLIALTKTVKRIADALLIYGRGLNIIQNNNKEAGQLVPHVHFHLIPRFENDGLIIEKWHTHKPTNEELEKTASKIKSLLK